MASALGTSPTADSAMTDGGTGSDTWRLGRRPALDGLRGVAVLLVVVSHLFEAGPMHTLGPVGVTIFFTLSGFLITCLMLEEHTDTGRVALPAFYRRRVLRLAPALLACVLLMALIDVLVGGSLVGWPLVVGALTYSSNWIQAAGLGADSALAHTWSLAVEEQFYLLWPAVLLLLRRGPRTVVVTLLCAGIVASVGLRFALIGEGWARVYFGFDTHADALLVGCLLAVVMHGRIAGRSHSAWPALCLLAAVPVMFAGMSFALLLLPLVVALTFASAIFASVQATEVRWLSWAPLVLVGRRSYGLYLWHYPVILLTNRLLGDPGWLVLAATAVPVSWGLATLSWRYVERPFLRRKGHTVVPVTRAYQFVSSEKCSYGAPS